MGSRGLRLRKPAVIDDFEIRLEPRSGDRWWLETKLASVYADSEAAAHVQIPCLIPAKISPTVEVSDAIRGINTGAAKIPVALTAWQME